MDMKRMLITHAHTLTMTQRTLLDHDILVQDGKIVEIGPQLTALDAQIVDLDGAFIMPGLFNCHVHTCSSASNDSSREHGEAEAVATIRTIKNLEKFNQSGVTFVRDAGGKQWADIHVRDAVKRGVFDGPEMQVAGKVIAMTGGTCWHRARECDGPDEVRKGTREQIKAGADWIKIMATGGVSTPGVHPNSCQFSEGEIRAAVEEAHKAGKKAFAHAQGTMGILNALRAGIDSIEHGCFLTQECVEFMAQNGVYYTPTLTALYVMHDEGVKRGLPQQAQDKANEVMERNLQSFRMAMQAGVKIVSGSDAGSPLNTHEKAAWEPYYMVQSGMDAYQALQCATTMAAQMCGVEDQLGTIEVGKRACFAVFDKNPIEDMEAIRHCKMTIKDGKRIFG